VENGSQAVLAGPSALLVFTGAACKMWKTPNSADCVWDAVTQSFSGPGCVIPPASTLPIAQQPPTCLCTHLTDFASLLAPNVPVAAPEQMLAVTPALALQKARVFIIITACLFIGMHALVAFMAYFDRRRRSCAVTDIFSPAMGYTAGAADKESALVWTWRLSLVEDEETGMMSGSAVRFAAAIGLPVARLQFAIPEELLDLSCDNNDGISVATSTALVFALLQTRLLMEPEEVALAQLEAERHFANGAPLPIPFSLLVDHFVEMLASQTLARPTHWLACARLWRLILLRRGGGGWGPTNGIAAVFYARGHETEMPRAHVHPTDFDAATVIDSCPHALKSAMDYFTALRVWTTLLCAEVLQNNSVCCFVDGGGHTHTLLDDAESYVERTLEQKKRTAASPRAAALLDHAGAALLEELFIHTYVNMCVIHTQKNN
jgi:hypothetical protein